MSRRQRRLSAVGTSAVNLVAAAVLGLLLHPCKALRPSSGAGSSSRGAGEASGRAVEVANYEVDLLVARHGLSCTNVVEKWVHKWDFGRGRISDPLLSGAGEHGSESSSSAVAAWLEENEFEVDAVLSSELLRAQQTALLTWPEAASPLYVAPFIRETAAGSSNFPKEPADQLSDLSEVIGSDLRVSYEWVKLYGGSAGSTSGDWQKFLHFLEQSFLPDLIERTGKPSGSRLVLGIVSHSLLMRDSISECSQHWEKHGTAKPLNNQVLRLEYSFTIAPQLRWPHVDVTPLYTLTRTAVECSEVAPGLHLKDVESHKKIDKLCLSDIGYSCIEPIARYSLKPDWLWGQTNEKLIIDAAKRLRKQTSRVQRIVGELEGVRKMLRQDGLDVQKLALLSDEKQRLSKKSIQAHEEMDRLRKDLKEQLNEHCWTGGKPNPFSYSKLLKVPLGPELMDLIAQN